jgi:hypothetical protein
VYGPGVCARSSRYCQLSTIAYLPTSARSRHTNVK